MYLSFFLSCVSLSLSDGDEEKDFDIQINTGTISIARRLDAARHSNYNLTVRVTDGHHSATTQVNDSDRNRKTASLLRTGTRDLFRASSPSNTASINQLSLGKHLLYCVHIELIFNCYVSLYLGTKTIKTTVVCLLKGTEGIKT